MPSRYRTFLSAQGSLLLPFFAFVTPTCLPVHPVLLMPGDPGNISVILSPQEYYITENRDAHVESGIVDPAGEGESGTY